MGIQAEVFDNMDPNLEILKLILEIIDQYILAIFLLEIVLKWVDDFWSFWKCTWNLVDFSITLLAMSSIFMLLLVFAYIFSVVGVILFESYSRSSIEGLVYKMNFKDLWNSFISLFILLTTDHWYALLADTRKVPDLDQTISGLYIILWLILGSFIFSNIFVGILDWESYVEENMVLMQEQEEDEKVIWPRDSLFRYFELLEMLQHNLDERQRLQNMSDQFTAPNPPSGTTNVMAK
ncbi:hypothetical protein DPEC_G00222050 [Dallia pectoralis]|uniref:Uncharacterized protein n=1 Tax=Dallia pectoralis TaxID=75939 RepID=A0ACC2G4F9_DALPE|nr:hypothetical protein DPEC_G00222050 [Dallia pectoralis]